MRMLSFLFAVCAMSVFVAPAVLPDPLHESEPAVDVAAPPQVPLIFQAGPDWGRG